MRRTMRSISILAVILVVGQCVVDAQESLGTAFSYQGQLKEGGAPANGDYDLEFKLFDDPVAGTQIGSDFLLNDWPVSDGLFTVELDFGSGIFAGNALWLEVSVAPGGGDFTTLSPRQPLNAAPYALYALDGPGSAGFWAANGTDVYNTNSGNVGIGASPDPGAKLHLVDDSSPRLWIDGNGVATPVLYFRGAAGYSRIQSGQDIRFNMGGGGWSDDVTITHTGRVGIGTTEPVASLQVINDGESHAIWAETEDIGLYAHRTATSGTWPAVHGECDSLYTGASGVRGVILSTDPGPQSAGVYGVNHGTGTFDGYGVRGHHDGAGVGVYGYAPLGRGVQGVSDTGTGVSGSSDSFYGVYGGSTSYVGVWGNSNSDVGVKGTSEEHDGVVGVNNGGSYHSGVYGETTATDGYGVFGRNTAPFTLTEGYLGGPNYGVWGYAIDNVEEQWWSLGYIGGAACAVYGEAHGSAIAARFVGNVEIASATSGATLIEFGEGLDYAEGFDVSDESEIMPGTVVVIDPDNPGKLVMSDTPYDRKVAGIVAGANGLGSAVRLGAGQFDLDVALAGRVYCNVDATYGAVQPGDLLTTSPTPGYAMKVTDHAKAQGAILGKAMESLEEGQKGQTLVLVTLQ